MQRLQRIVGHEPQPGQRIEHQALRSVLVHRFEDPLGGLSQFHFGRVKQRVFLSGRHVLRAIGIRQDDQLLRSTSRAIR